LHVGADIGALGVTRKESDQKAYEAYEGGFYEAWRFIVATFYSERILTSLWIGYNLSTVGSLHHVSWAQILLILARSVVCDIKKSYSLRTLGLRWTRVFFLEEKLQVLFIT
jgi:hypothetical protein